MFFRVMAPPSEQSGIRCKVWGGPGGCLWVLREGWQSTCEKGEDGWEEGAKGVLRWVKQVRGAGLGTVPGIQAQLKQETEAICLYWTLDHLVCIPLIHTCTIQRAMSIYTAQNIVRTENARLWVHREPTSKIKLHVPCTLVLHCCIANYLKT